MAAVNHLQPAANRITVKVFGHAQLSVEKELVFDDRDVGEEGSAYALIIIRCGTERVEQRRFVIVHACIVAVCVEISESDVYAALAFEALPTYVSASRKAVFVGIAAECHHCAHS